MLTEADILKRSYSNGTYDGGKEKFKQDAFEVLKLTGHPKAELLFEMCENDQDFGDLYSELFYKMQRWSVPLERIPTLNNSNQNDNDCKKEEKMKKSSQCI